MAMPSPVAESWLEVYRSLGCTLAFEDWATFIGSDDAEYNPLRDLTRQLDGELDGDAILRAQRQREHEMILELPVLPGVQDYLEVASRLGLRIGMASSSSCDWVEGHLERLGLRAYFERIQASDDVALTKPDPALYLNVCAELGVPTSRAVALEDSPNGALAAKRAGMYCVIVPNAMTANLPFPTVDLRLDSLADLPLEELLDSLG